MYYDGKLLYLEADSVDREALASAARATIERLADERNQAKKEAEDIELERYRLERDGHKLEADDLEEELEAARDRVLMLEFALDMMLEPYLQVYGELMEARH